MDYMTGIANSPVYEFPYSGNVIPPVPFLNNDVDSILAVRIILFTNYMRINSYSTEYCTTIRWYSLQSTSTIRWYRLQSISIIYITMCSSNKFEYRKQCNCISSARFVFFFFFIVKLDVNILVVYRKCAIRSDFTTVWC